MTGCELAAVDENRLRMSAFEAGPMAVFDAGVDPPNKSSRRLELVGAGFEALTGALVPKERVLNFLKDHSPKLV